MTSARSGGPSLSQARTPGTLSARPASAFALAPGPPHGSSATGPRPREPPVETGFAPRLGERGEAKDALLRRYVATQAAGGWSVNEGTVDGLAALAWEGNTGPHRARQLAVIQQYEADCEAHRTAPWPATVASVSHWLMRRERTEPRSEDYYSRLVGLLRSGAELLRPGQWAITESETRLLHKLTDLVSGATPRSTPRRATPAEHSALAQLAGYLRPAEATPADQMIWVVLCVSVQSARRSGDVVELRWEDVKEMPDGSIHLRWVEEKTKAEQVSPLVPMEGLEATSGLEALRLWLSRREVQDMRARDGPRGFLFPRIQPSSRRVLWRGEDQANPHLTQEQHASSLKRLATAAGLEGCERFTGHAGRRGGATELRRAGASNEAIMQTGGWSSEEAMLRYIAVSDVDRARDNARLLVERQRAVTAAARPSVPQKRGAPEEEQEEDGGLEAWLTGPSAQVPLTDAREERTVHGAMGSGGSGARAGALPTGCTPRERGAPAGAGAGAAAVTTAANGSSAAPTGAHPEAPKRPRLSAGAGAPAGQ